MHENTGKERTPSNAEYSLTTSAAPHQKFIETSSDLTCVQLNPLFLSPLPSLNSGSLTFEMNDI